jgi:glutamate racemase
MRIGVFDSGVGGLSVLAAIHSALPVHELIYCCDYLNLPYGTKPDDMVINCAKAVTKKFFEAAKPDILVIACNTVSTVALQDIRKMLPIPVVGVVPAIKPAAERSGTKTIGLLATPATIKRAYTADLIRDFAADVMFCCADRQNWC